MSLSRFVLRGLKNCSFISYQLSVKPSKSIYSHINNVAGLQISSSRTLNTGIVSRQEEPIKTEKVEREDRTEVIPVETSIRYLESEAYKEAYGDRPVWTEYRRNHKGAFAPQKTRKRCIRRGAISTGNPCPICRDKYLVLDCTNIKLLKQFISPYTGEILSYKKTGLCQTRYQELLVAVERAKDIGLITFDVPFREYDYSQYSKPLSEKSTSQQPPSMSRG